MRCSGCGKEIPFAGDVCPYCQRDKSADQGTHALLVISIVIGGAIGYFANDFMGFIVGAIIGGVAGILMALFNGASQTSKPPEVRVTSESSPITKKPESDLAKRLTSLDDLKARGLISESEWAEKRQSILGQI